MQLMKQLYLEIFSKTKLKKWISSYGYSFYLLQSMNLCTNCKRYIRNPKKLEDFVCPFCSSSHSRAEVHSENEIDTAALENRFSRFGMPLKLMLAGAAVLSAGCPRESQVSVYGGPPIERVPVQNGTLDAGEEKDSSPLGPSKPPIGPQRQDSEGQKK